MGGGEGGFEDLFKLVPWLESLFFFPWSNLYLSRKVFGDLCSSRQDCGLFIYLSQYNQDPAHEILQICIAESGCSLRPDE